MSEDRGHLSTEQRNPAAAQLDRMSVLEAVDLMTSEDARAVEAVAAVRDELAAAVDLVSERLAAGGRLIYVGAGTSGRLAVLDAAECPPTFRSDPTQVQAILAGGRAALTAAVEGAEDDAEEGAAQVAVRDVGPGDVVLGISAGGTTPFVHGALGEARRRGAATIFLACVSRAEVGDEADLSIRLATGPEVVAGSTRLKAGTATKLALNTISTLVMVRLGKVHGDLMVDLDTSANVKLVDRARRILAAITGVEPELAAALLERAGGRVKVAAVMHARELDVRAAEERLAQVGGLLRCALEPD